MLKQRIITAVVLAPLAIAGFVLLEGAGFALFVGAIVVLGAWEWARLAGEEGQKGRIVYALVVALLMVGLYQVAWPAQYLLLPALAWWVVALVLISRYPKGRGLWAGSMISQLFGLLILLPAWYALVWLRALESGLWLILGVLVLIWAADIGASGPVNTVLIFANDNLVHIGSAEEERYDVAQALGDGAGIRSGFSVVLPKALFVNGGGKGDAAIRLFALTQAGAAAELPFKQSQ